MITPSVSSIEHIGKIALIEKDYKDVVVGGFVLMLQPHVYEEVLSKYLLFAFATKTHRDNCRRITHKSGQAFYNLSREKLMNLAIPLPPLAEQQRIVAKLEETLPHIENYKIAHSKIEKLNTDFPEKLKKSILQWAVQGKLVPQNENDEPASVLLERIREEKAQLIKDKKIKKDTAESIIFKSDNSHYEKIGNIEKCIDDEIPFGIPESWVWVRLPTISNFISAGGDKPQIYSQSKTTECCVPIYSNGEKNNGLYGFTNVAKIFEPSITISGRGTIGFSCIRTEPYVPIVRLISVIPNKYVNLNYLYYVFLGLFEKGVGTSIQQLTVPMLMPKLIPIPPLNEQYRIIEKVEQILKLNEKL